jgi:hypothetical protein
MRVSPPLAGGHYRPMARTKKHRPRIDMMIDAHIWMRRAARIQGEWPATGQNDALPSCKDCSMVDVASDNPCLDHGPLVPKPLKARSS